jgi:hypothetical protein
MRDELLPAAKNRIPSHQRNIAVVLVFHRLRAPDIRNQTRVTAASGTFNDAAPNRRISIIWLPAISPLLNPETTEARP